MKKTPAHHTSGGFRNPWPGEGPRGLGGFLRWQVERARLADSRTPRALIDPPEPAADPAIVPERARLHVTWVGHSTFLLQLGGVNVLTDPMWSERASPFDHIGPRRLSPPGVRMDDLPAIHAVLVSHDHYDHLDRKTVDALVARYPQARWLAPLRVGRWLVRRGASDVTELDWWHTTIAGPLRVTCVPARHFSGRGPTRNTTLWCGWAVSTTEASVFFAGDTALHPEFRRIARSEGPFDAVILPIGAYSPRWFMRAVHMDPADAVAAYRDLIAESPSQPVCIGSHWATFRLTDEPVDEPAVLTRRLWSDARLDARRLWIMTPGEVRSL